MLCTVSLELTLVEMVDQIWITVSVSLWSQKKRNPVTGEFSAHTEHLGSMLFPWLKCHMLLK